MTHDLNKPFGVALIGPGGFGRSLMRRMLDDERVNLMGVLGVNAADSAAGAEALGGHAYADLDALLKDDTVQAVVIATPTSTHKDYTVAAAGAGKHVFCEKPMALTVAECDQMIEATQRAEVALMIGQMQRFAPLLVEAQRLVQSGRLGRPVTAQNRRHDMLQRTTGSWYQRRAAVGGLLHQNTVHEIDWLRQVLGEVDEVYARAAPTAIQPGLDFPDAYEVSVRFASGCVCSVSACMTTFVQQHDGAIQGTEGSLTLNLTGGRLTWRNRAGEGADEQRHEYRLSQGADIGVRKELRAFVDSALTGAAVLIPGEEGRANIEVIQASLISLAEGVPVALPLARDQWARPAHLELRV